MSGTEGGVKYGFDHEARCRDGDEFTFCGMADERPRFAPGHTPDICSYMLYEATRHAWGVLVKAMRLPLIVWARPETFWAMTKPRS